MKIVSKTYKNLKNFRVSTSNPFYSSYLGGSSVFHKKKKTL